MRGIILGLPMGLALWCLLAWCAWPLIGRPKLDVGQIPQHYEVAR